jgi:hypothetical protein
VSPITGELIPIGEMAEHMRISLIDPKYREQKELMMAKIRDTTKGEQQGLHGGGWGWVDGLVLWTPVLILVLALCLLAVCLLSVLAGAPEV